MTPRYIRTEHAEFQCSEITLEVMEVAPYRPIGDNVLVLTDKVREKTSGGILVPGTTASVHNAGAESGVIVALGNDAFRLNNAGTRMLKEEERPKVGDRVCFTRYSGTMIVRGDFTFRMMTDTCIGGVEIPQEDGGVGGVTSVQEMEAAE